MPLVWSTELGKGRIVVDNIGVYDKVMRGFYAASYSLLGDACAYPVLNSAVFFWTTSRPPCRRATASTSASNTG